MTNSTATHYAVDDAPDATVLPTSEVVVAAHASDAMVNVLANAPAGDTNHVLCRGYDEPLTDFGRRVEWRLRALRKKSSIRRVRYLLGPPAPQDKAPQDRALSRQVLVTVLGLLGSGAVFELVTPPSCDVDVVQTLDELMPYARVGVQVSIRREEVPREELAPGTESGDRDLTALPGLARTDRSGVFYTASLV